jgi:hypothetical protein
MGRNILRPMYINLSIFVLEAKAVQLENSCPLKGQTMPLVHMVFLSQPTLVAGGQSVFLILMSMAQYIAPLHNIKI